MNNLNNFQEIAIAAATTAGTIIKSHLGKLDSIKEKGRPGDLVTIADQESEAGILKVLQQHLPDHQILAEESGKLGNQNSKYLWAIDPLDGTTNFAHQYPFFAVSIGLLIDGIPSVGVIYDPYHDELYSAVQGGGATCNGKKIQVSNTEQLNNSLLVTGFAYDRTQTTDNNYAEFCHLTHLTQGVRRSGAASIDLAHTACGRLDGYWERGLSPWDIVAGIVILQEAGGKVTAYDQSPIQINSGRILATNGHIHSQLSQALLTVPPLSAWGEKTSIS
jgi:myo-inositol-1(or 4)-monophosphatase